MPRDVDGHLCSATNFRAISACEVEQSLVDRFAHQVAIHRDCLAVRDPRHVLSYGELDSWANAIAGEILDRSSDGTPVGILLPQGAANIAAILGVLKSGSPYVSLDPADPRSDEIVEHIGGRVVVVGDRSRSTGRRGIVLVEGPREGTHTAVRSSPDDVACIYFTSGSSGRPKGVFDSHRNLLHNVLRYTNTLRIAPPDRLSLIQSPAFSGTASSIFASLLNGASLFPFSLSELGLPGLGRWLRRERVTIYHSVPAIFRSLVEVDGGPYGDIRLVRLEGDRATWSDVALHRRHCPSAVLVNGLGLTETGLIRQLFVDASMATEDGVLPVGYAVPDVDVVILRDDGEVAPSGHSGEIAVQGPYLSLGYWGDTELTVKAFPSIGDRRTYRTGDLGRLHEDGCLEYLGRRDGQLKVLGARVEPAEVEAVLLRLRGVEDAAVTTYEGRRGEGRLVAYVVHTEASERTERDLRATLATQLPSCMVPSSVVFVEALPLSPTGKVDRRALVETQGPPRGTPPGTELERTIARVWEAVLETSPINRDDDFFALGGDSLASAEIVARLEGETGIPLPMSILAGAPTVRTLANRLHRVAPRTPSSLVELSADGDPPALVLVHGNLGHAIHYSDLVRVAGSNRPVWALEHRGPVAESIDDMAAAHARALLDAQAEDPVLLAGFCYGAVVAHELACRLVAGGHTVGLLALLGITPLEFPDVVSPNARRAWGHRYTTPPFGAKVRAHLDTARGLPALERPRYVGRRVANLMYTTARRATGRLDGDTRKALAFDRALAQHHAGRFQGRALLVLHEGDTAVYTADPEQEWAKLADEVEVVTVPGSHHAMLEGSGALRVAELLDERAKRACAQA